MQTFFFVQRAMREARDETLRAGAKATKRLVSTIDSSLEVSRCVRSKKKNVKNVQKSVLRVHSCCCCFFN